MRLLLIEDEPLIALDLETILEGLGHEVVGLAVSHAEALRLTDALRPDGAFVDVRLKDGFTGPGIARALRDDYGVACAFVTGNPEQVADAGFTVIRKPFDRGAIAAFLADLD